MEQPFSPVFSADPVKRASELIGFSKCLKEFYVYIAQVTEHNPNKRYIDAVPLLGKIESTTKALEAEMLEVKDGLIAEMGKFTPTT